MNTQAPLHLLDPDYIDAWTDMMTHIWRERITRMQAIDTQALHQSLTLQSQSQSSSTLRISFDFLEYGIYVDSGTGRGYTRGNGGNLQFLDAAHRIRHRLGKPREKKPWFSPSWYISRQVLAEHLAQQAGALCSSLFLPLTE